MRVPLSLIAVLLLGLTPLSRSLAQDAVPAAPIETSPPPAVATPVVMTREDAPANAPSPEASPVAVTPSSDPDAETPEAGGVLAFLPRITVQTALLFVGVPCALICAVLAQKKRLQTALWAVSGLLFGPFALIAVVIAPENAATALVSPPENR